jgi:phosphate-selective porin OprO/OprP
MRTSFIPIRRDVYSLGLPDPSNAARRDRDWGIGANWSLNKMVRLMLDFNQSRFTGGAKNGGDRPNEDVIESRVQFVF